MPTTASDGPRTNRWGDVPPDTDGRPDSEELVGQLKLLDLFHDLVSVHDTDGAWRYMSAGCKAFLGVASDAFQAGGFDRKLHPDDRDLFDSLFELPSQAQARSVQVRVRVAPGGWVWAEVNPRLVTVRNAREVVVLVWRDVTAERQLDRVSRLLHRAAAKANETNDPATLLQGVGADVAATLGWSYLGAWRHQEGNIELLALDQSDRHGAPPDGPIRSRLRDRVHKHMTPSSESLQNVHPSNDHAPGVVTVPAYVGDDVKGGLEFRVPDVTELDEPLAEVLRHVGIQLGHVLERQQHLDALERANVELERSNDELERFAYVASHDLQEPLRKIASFCSLLQRRYGEQLDADGGEFLQFAVDGAVRMQGLINDLLAYSRVGRGGQTPSVVDLGATLGQAIEDLGGAIEDTAAVVDVVGGLPNVRARKDDVVAVLANLVSNGVKFHRPGVAPHIRITGQVVDGFVRVTVSDNGIGIEPRHQERIFGVFQRLHGSAAYPGTGIGLALCRRIVESYGGAISCSSSAGHGATFAITLPAAPGG